MALCQCFDENVHDKDIFRKEGCFGQLFEEDKGMAIYISLGRELDTRSCMYNRRSNPNYLPKEKERER